jgi:hypothetical protein
MGAFIPLGIFWLFIFSVAAGLHLFKLGMRTS